MKIIVDSPRFHKRDLINLRAVLPDINYMKFITLPKLFSGNRRFKESDFFIVSYPRSGNTWLRVVISDIILQNHGYTTATRLPVHQDDIIPDIYRDDINFKHEGITLKNRLIKTHDKYDKRWKNAIYITRRAEDALLSYYYFHLRYENLKNLAKDGPDAFCTGFLNGWIGNVQSWLDAYNNKSARVLFLTYEDLLARTYENTERALAFLEIEYTPEVIRTAINNQSFEKLARNERGAPLTEHGYREYFFRKGKAGSAVEELSEETIKIIRAATDGIYTQVEKIISRQ